MAKIRVHELAKEIGQANKAVIEYLNSKGYDVVAAVSVVPESEVSNIRAHFGAASPEEKAPETSSVKEESEKKAAPKKKEEEKPKKSGIVRVFRSENASRQLQRRPTKKTARPSVEAPAIEEEVTPLVEQDVIETPVEETKAAAPVAEAAPEVTETAAPAGDKAPEKDEAAAASPEEAPAKPAKAPAAKKTAAPKEEEKKPARAEKAEKADKAEDKAESGFKNGRVLRNIGQIPQNPPARTGARGRDGADRGRGRTGAQRGTQGTYAGRTDRGAAGPGRGPQTRGGSQMPARGGQAGRPGRGGAARPADAPADNGFQRKAGRDRKDGKDRERNREERREMGHGETGRPGTRRSNMGRIPKALQQKHHTAPAEKKEEAVTEIRVPERITVRDLADKMKIAPAIIIKDLFMKGQMVTVNHELTYDKAEEIAMEHDIICEMEEKEDVIGELLADEADDESTMVTRPPVVCVMGHVDHGKTSLLDSIRDTRVTDREAGGITQHIGAYMVTVNGQKITFLDTPGHEAFTAMRMRGANATDIAVLVVAADDGVMPQTVEAINHAKAAGTEIIVAVNKIDKDNTNIDRIKKELSEHDLLAEDWGGTTIFCPVSAKTGEGIDNLLEMILLTAEMRELKANPNRKVRGIVLEARLDKGRGPVASILIEKGTLRQGDFIACGAACGKVRAMTDENGKRLNKATPSMPVEIIGLNQVPEAGEVLVSFDTDKEAKDFAAVFVTEGKKTLIEETRHQMSLGDLFAQIKEGNLKELPIIVKADVQGSVEAVSQSLLKLSNEEVVVKVIHGGVGTVNESDVSLAAASNAIIIGFNVRLDPTAKMMADNQNVEVDLYSVIYEAIEDVERALKGMRAAVYEEKIQGHAEIRQIFKASGIGNIAGAYVRDGIFTRTSKVRVFRGSDLLFEGELASLKRFKDDVKEVREGFECGLVFKDFGDFEVDDTVEAYTMVEVERT